MKKIEPSDETTVIGQETTEAEVEVQPVSSENESSQAESGGSLAENSASSEGEKPAASTEKKSVKQIALKLCRRYFITAFSGMATGLFCTLIAGTIICQISKIFGDSGVARFLNSIGTLAKMLMGAGIGVGIAHSLKAPKLTLACCAVAGFLGAYGTNFVAYVSGSLPATLPIKPGDPVTAYLCSVVACELGILVTGKTKIDILVVPLTVLIVGGLVSLGFAKPIGWLMTVIGNGINAATTAQPFFMGIIVSVSMGILLTLPTSSAAIGISIGLSGIAAGAAVAGCCAHMVGFAVSSYRENKVGGLIAQGLGTSMLQIPNLKKPQIMLPAIIASAIGGPVASCIFKLQASSVGSGMGTSGLVGVIDCVSTSLSGGVQVWVTIVGVIVVCFLLPAVISLVSSEIMRKKGWIKFGDMKIDL